ncbi:MAG: bifunctional serine/threonine-protein kinase/formylglycine-generating enzyme family protein [Candidatus Hydrogenedentales bacterium]|jgi:formylglycine-generating enzyme required for sulfatase activity/tRNA A-37 threonylcarbamoyl transferase component Bud32
MITVTCSKCGLKFLVPPAVQGRSGVCFGCGSSLTIPRGVQPEDEMALAFEVGASIEGRYEIEGPLGKGGMGVVYSARDTLMNERVALKFLNPQLLQTQKGIQLFIHEAQIARRLRHENIVAVHDVAATPEGIMYLSMEFLAGRSLRAVLRHFRTVRRFMDVRLAVDLTAQILDALDYAHRTVIHRDMKPENVMLQPGERVKVLDFGLAKVLDEGHHESGSREKGKRSSVVGTEAYAAPEQLRHSEVDLRADLYAVGLMFREMLTLRTPLEEQVEVQRAREDVAPSLLAILEKAIKEAPEDRWQSAGEFRRDLLRAYTESYRRAQFAAGAQEEGRHVSTEGMVLMEGGSFLMGNASVPDEAPPFETYVEPFHIDIHPVTVGQYAEFLEATAHPNPKFWGQRDYGGEQQPVVGVSWEDAMAYAQWAGKQLPSEAQWEFVARGKENRRYPWGNNEPDSNRANYGDHLNMPSIVGMHEDGATPDGIQDMAGNVHEWTLDWFLPYDPAKRDTAAQLGPPRRTVRGGSWNSPPQELRCSARKGLFPESRLPTVGFRCVLPRRP